MMKRAYFPCRCSHDDCRLGVFICEEDETLSLHVYKDKDKIEGLFLDEKQLVFLKNFLKQTEADK